MISSDASSPRKKSLSSSPYGCLDSDALGVLRNGPISSTSASTHPALAVSPTNNQEKEAGVSGYGGYGGDLHSDEYAVLG